MSDVPYRYTSTEGLPKITSESVREIDEITLRKLISGNASYSERTIIVQAELKRRDDEVAERRHLAELSLGREAVEASKEANRISEDAVAIAKDAAAEAKRAIMAAEKANDFAAVSNKIAERAAKATESSTTAALHSKWIAIAALGLSTLMVIFDLWQLIFN